MLSWEASELLAVLHDALVIEERNESLLAICTMSMLERI
jgi:hypothetical protein